MMIAAAADRSCSSDRREMLAQAAGGRHWACRRLIGTISS